MPPRKRLLLRQGYSNRRLASPPTRVMVNTPTDVIVTIKSLPGNDITSFVLYQVDSESGQAEEGSY
jgi:hypothetical protein